MLFLIELVGAMVFSMVLAVLYEGLKSLREYLIYKALNKRKTMGSINKKYSDLDKESLVEDSTGDPRFGRNL